MDYVKDKTVVEPEINFSRAGRLCDYAKKLAETKETKKGKEEKGNDGV